MQIRKLLLGSGELGKGFAGASAVILADDLSTIPPSYTGMENACRKETQMSGSLESPP